MSMWTAIVLIVAITSLAQVFSARYRRDHKVSQHRGDGEPVLPAHREAELEREVLDLKKRLAVLERIATDDRQSKAIAHEIESLRDR